MTADLEQDPIEKEQPEQETTQVEEAEDRWSAILTDVHERHKSTQPWYQRLGITLGWSAGIGLSTGLVALLLLVIVNLFTKERLLTARNASDWLFWGAALLLLSGLVAPTETGEEEENSNTSRSGNRTRAASTRRATSSRASNADDKKPVRTFEERQSRAMHKRLMRVYNPWRWRLWLSALFCFSLSVLMGVLS